METNIMHVYPTIAVAVEAEISAYTDEIIIIDSENIENNEICINITSDISDTIDPIDPIDTIVLVDVIGDGDQTNYCMNFCEYIIVLIIIGIIGTSSYFAKQT